MSESADKESKTEAPTEKKISEAVERGNTPFSREIVSFGSLLAIIGLLGLTLAASAESITRTLRIGFAKVGEPALQTPSDASNHLGQILGPVLAAVLPILALCALGGVVGSIVQNIPAASWERVAPKLNRLSPSKNLARIAGKEALIEFAKTSAKFLALSALAYVVLQGKLNDMLNAGLTDPAMIPNMLKSTVLDIAIPTAVFVFLLAVIDLVWTRIKWRNDLKMTKQEQKDEHKNAEGDPLFKQKRRMIAQKRLKSRMMADIPRATLVVVNPTHYAVALRYVASEGGAPVVLAKGLDLVALKIRELSDLHSIPIIENKPLARSLHSACEIGDMIPPEYYKAVAEIIHFIERKRQLGTGLRIAH
jgi:flagellar biosynthesis protein FlhB